MRSYRKFTSLERLAAAVEPGVEPPLAVGGEKNAGTTRPYGCTLLSIFET